MNSNTKSDMIFEFYRENSKSMSASTNNIYKLIDLSQVKLRKEWIFFTDLGVICVWLKVEFDWKKDSVSIVIPEWPESY